MSGNVGVLLVWHWQFCWGTCWVLLEVLRLCEDWCFYECDGHDLVVMMKAHIRENASEVWVFVP